MKNEYLMKSPAPVPVLQASVVALQQPALQQMPAAQQWVGHAVPCRSSCFRQPFAHVLLSLCGVCQGVTASAGPVGRLVLRDHCPSTPTSLKLLAYAFIACIFLACTFLACMVSLYMI